MGMWIYAIDVPKKSIDSSEFKKEKHQNKLKKNESILSRLEVGN